MSDLDTTERLEWPEGVIALRHGPGANCSSMGSAIQFMWAAAALSGVVAVVAAALIGPRRPSPPPTGTEKPEGSGTNDEPAST